MQKKKHNNRNGADGGSSSGTSAVIFAQSAIAACAAARAAEAGKAALLKQQVLDMIQKTGAELEIVNGMPEGIIKCTCGVTTRFARDKDHIQVFTRGPRSDPSCSVTAAILRFVSEYRQ